MTAVLLATVFGLSSRTPILTYHDIVPARTKDTLWFDCTVQEFKDQIKWLQKQGAVFVSSQDVYLAIQRKRSLPKNAICITFADNYMGFYRYAWPILKAAKIHSTQFVHTGYVGSKIGRPKMNWEQLTELDRSGLVTIASQTVTHPADLTKMKADAILDEFKKSKQMLETKLGHPISEIAYPNGKYDARVAKLAKQAGYIAAFTEDCRPSETAPNLFEVPRYVHTKYLIAWKSKLMRH